MEKIAGLKRLLHGRQRKRMRLAMSERIRDMEALLEAKKLGKLIQKLLPDYTDPLDFNQLSDLLGQPFTSPKTTHKAATRTMQEWMGIPATLNRIANYMEVQATAWLDLLRGTYPVEANPIPRHIRLDIAKAMRAKPVPVEVRQALVEAMNMTFSFEEFEHCRRHLTEGKSPGPSGLTTIQVKHWGPETAKLVYDLSSIMWQHHHVPQWWQDRLMTLSFPRNRECTISPR